MLFAHTGIRALVAVVKGSYANHNTIIDMIIKMSCKNLNLATYFNFYKPAMQVFGSMEIFEENTFIDINRFL